MDPEEQGFRRRIETDPLDAAARMGLAKSLLVQGRKVEAAEACEDAAAIYVQRENKVRALAVYKRLLRIYTQQGRNAERLRVAKRMLELEPDDPHGEIHVAIADAYTAAGDASSALAILHEEVRMLEAVAMLEILGNRASTQAGSAWKRVVAALERIAHLDRRDVPSRIQLARYQIQGRPAKALATLLEVLTLDRKNIDGLRLIDHAFLAVGHFDKAARTFEEIVSVDASTFERNSAIRDNAEDLAGSFMLIEATLDAGNLDDAIAAARALAEAHPNRIPVHRKLFDLYLRVPNPDAASKDLSRAVALALEAGDRDHARALLQAGLRVAPWNSNLREAAVRVMEHMKIFPE